MGRIKRKGGVRIDRNFDQMQGMDKPFVGQVLQGSVKAVRCPDPLIDGYRKQRVGGGNGQKRAERLRPDMASGKGAGTDYAVIAWGQWQGFGYIGFGQIAVNALLRGKGQHIG